MDAFINRLIECYFFARNFCLDCNLKFSIYFFLTVCHEVQQNNCNRDPQIANNNKKGVSSCVINIQAFFVSAVANRDVAIQNWWHFKAKRLQVYSARVRDLFLTSKPSWVRLWGGTNVLECKTLTRVFVLFFFVVNATMKQLSVHNYYATLCAKTQKSYGSRNFDMWCRYLGFSTWSWIS